MRRAGIPGRLRFALILVQILTGPLAVHAADGPAAGQKEGADKSLSYSSATGIPLLGGAIASVVLPRAIYKTPPACRWCDGAHPNAVDRWAAKARWSDPCHAARLSYWTVGAAAAVALGPSSREAGTGDWLDNAGTVVDSVAATIILTQVAKYTVRRERPSPSTCHPVGKAEADRNLSFFSGHTAIAFAMVSSAREMERLRGREPSGWLWAGGAAAAATGYFRVAGDRHHLVDVVAGAAVGSLVGRWLPRALHRSARSRSSPAAMAPVGPPMSSPSPFLYSRPIASGNRSVLLQVGPGPGRSLQVGLRF